MPSYDALAATANPAKFHNSTSRSEPSRQTGLPGSQPPEFWRIRLHSLSWQFSSPAERPSHPGVLRRRSRRPAICRGGSDGQRSLACRCRPGVYQRCRFLRPRSRQFSPNRRAAASHRRREITIPGRCRKAQLHRIPCCYELGPDLARVAEHAGLSAEEVIRLHAKTRFTRFTRSASVRAFPTWVICRLPCAECRAWRSPRLRVEAGSVGLTGRQTGIYTEERPGGWNLIGRTPLELVNVQEAIFSLADGGSREVRAD